jgi:hypothetical protein
MLCDSILKSDENEKTTIIINDVNNVNDVNDVNNNNNTVIESESSNRSIDYDYHGYEGNLVSFIGYNLEEELNIEKIQNEYHIMKQSGDWYYAKMIVSHAYQDKNNTDLFWDHLEKQFLKNGDSFNNIITAYYKNDLDIDIIYQFSQEPAKHLIDNLRISPYKPHGIIFSNPEDANKWSFKIVVITNKGIYTANRYITDDLIGFY